MRRKLDSFLTPIAGKGKKREKKVRKQVSPFLNRRDVPSLSGLISTVCEQSTRPSISAHALLQAKTIHLILGSKSRIRANTLTLFAVMNRASHKRGLWFIFLTFCMQRRRVRRNRANVTSRKTRSGLWEKKYNTPPLLSPPATSPLFCLLVLVAFFFPWALEVYLQTEKCMSGHQVFCCCFFSKKKQWITDVWSGSCC